MSIETLRNVIRDLLPSGPFWLSAAVDSFVHAMAAAVEPLDSFLEGLPTAINPGTAARAVLLDWWEYLRSDCSGTPTDTEELRARVIEALSAPPVHTFDGLSAIVLANGLNFVELRELPFISQVPFDVPSGINDDARILDVWNSPLLHDPTLVECVVRPFAQAADVLRFRVPSSILRDKGGTAGDRAFAWFNAWGTAAIEVERLAESGGAITSTTYALPEEDGAATWATVLGLLDTDDVSADLVRWQLLRDFGAGNVAITSKQNNQFTQVTAFETVAGVTPDFLWPGWFTADTAIDSVAKCPMVSNGVPVLAHAAGSGIDTNSGISLGYFALRNLTDAFTVQDTDKADITNESFLLAMTYRVNTKPTALRELVGKRDSVDDLRGWQVLINETNSISVIVDFEDVGATDQVAVTVNATATDPGWHVLVFLWDLNALQASMWTEALTATPVAIPGVATASSAPPLTIGDMRLDAPDADIAMVAIASGAQVESVDGAAIAAAVHAAMVL